MIIFMKCLAAVAVAISAVLLLVFVTLLAVPSVRHSAFRIVGELPATATFFLIRGKVWRGDFAAAAAGLQRQLDVSDWLNVDRSVVIPGLIENTEFAAERLRLKSQHLAMLPFLENLVEDQPEIYDARIWLARALILVDPRAALPHIEAAARLAPADGRAYRVGLEAAMASGAIDEARTWCERYQTAQLGGPDPYRFRNMFGGLGLRKVALEVSDGRGGEVMVSNEGLQTMETRVYDFSLPERVAPDKLVLHFGVVPGVRIRFGDVVLYGPTASRTLSVDDFVLTSLRGYILIDGTVISNSEDGEVVVLRPAGEEIGEISRVDIAINIERLGFSNLPGCQGSF